jgi:putative hydroxymethylpyrimidine transport system substrate-binding protein
LIAKQQGFFKQHGLHVNLIAPADPSDTTKLVALGKADIGISSDPELILLVGRNLPLLRIGALIDQPMVALASYDVKKLADIKGKTIGYAVGGIDKIILKVMLQHVGLKITDVNLVDVHYNLVQALLSKRVDAVTGAMRDYEIPQLKLEGMNTHSFYPEDYGMPRYGELNYVVNRAHRHDARIPKFLAALKQATQFINQHPNKSWRIMVRQHPELKTPLNKLSWKMTHPLFAQQPSLTHKPRIMALAALFKKEAVISEVKSYNHYVA